MREESFDETLQQGTFNAFEALVSGKDDAIDLAQAAFLIASIAHPYLNIASYMAQLDAFAQRVGDILGLAKPDPHVPLALALPSDIDRRAVLEAINRVLFEQEHFSGNGEDYYNPANSFLNDVLERQVGIPITLSLLYIEVGQRIGLSLDGIGLPFHFVVGCRLPDCILYIDPFERGVIYNEQECRERVRRMLKGRTKLHPQWFQPVSKRQFLARMLNNLKHIYMSREEYERALSICTLLVLLVPALPAERRDRGVVHLHLKHYMHALRDLTAYIDRAPDAEDRSEVQRQIKSLRQFISMMN